jgi:hypothetical protein
MDLPTRENRFESIFYSSKDRIRDRLESPIVSTEDSLGYDSLISYIEDNFDVDC